MSTAKTQPYIRLISSFLGGSIPVAQFEQDYLRLFKTDSGFSESEFLILDSLFADVDAFVEDSMLREKGDLDESQLRIRCAEALRKLQFIG